MAVPSRSMRVHTARFSSSLMNTQFDTSPAVRPQPLQTSSKSVEHTPMHGLSGRAWRLEAIGNLAAEKRRSAMLTDTGREAARARPRGRYCGRRAPPASASPRDAVADSRHPVLTVVVVEQILAVAVEITDPQVAAPRAAEQLRERIGELRVDAAVPVLRAFAQRGRQLPAIGAAVFDEQIDIAAIVRNVRITGRADVVINFRR